MTEDLQQRIDRAVALAKFEAWEQGFASGHSNAMRRMSDEPDAPIPTNPYAPKERA